MAFGATGGAAGGGRRPFFRRRKTCPFSGPNAPKIDYKDTKLLSRYISERGKIRSRRITGACRRHQNQIATAVKRARELALLPYVGDNREDRDERGRPRREDRER